MEPPSGDYADYGITYTQPGGAGWYVSEIRHIPVGANGGYPGNHNVYVNTYDWTGWPNDPETHEWALHIPVRHIKVAYWCSGEDTPSPDNEHWVVQETWPDSPDGEGLDFPLFSQNTCKVAVWEVGVPSSIVSGIHTRHPDEGEDVRVGHHSFRIFFTRLESVEPTPRPTPTPAPTWTPRPTPTPAPTSTPRPTPTPAPTWTPGPTFTATPTATSIATATPDAEQIFREAAWNEWLGEGHYNPSATFSIYAIEHELGVPLMGEFDVGSYRVQGFANGIVFCEIGQWQDVRGIDW